MEGQGRADDEATRLDAHDVVDRERPVALGQALDRGLERGGVLEQRRDGLEPVGLVRKVDIDPFERHALLGKRNRRALDIGAKMMADEG